MTNHINNQSIIPSTDVIQLTLTLKMTTAQVVETSVTVNNDSPIQDYFHPDDQTQPTFTNYRIEHIMIRFHGDNSIMSGLNNLLLCGMQGNNALLAKR